MAGKRKVPGNKQITNVASSLIAEFILLRVSKYSNNRYLSTPQRAKKMSDLQAKVNKSKQMIKKLKSEIANLTERNGMQVDPELHDDMTTIMRECNIDKLLPEGSFKRLFWEEQLKMAKQKDARQMRWHPTMIRMCLNIKLLSSSTYHALRTSGFMKLPSERTLRDYTHYFKNKARFSDDVDEMLSKEAKLADLPSWKKHVTIVMDEIKVKEKLVYDKYETRVIGFVDLGEVNDQLDKLEHGNNTPDIATYVLTIMVRGIFINLRFPYANFPTTSITGDALFLIIWEAVERLEKIGFKVLVITGDGASANRRFINMHGKKTSTRNPCYKTKNPYSQDKRDIYFMSDPPHLMKTARNCWSHSGDEQSRNMWVCQRHFFKIMIPLFLQLLHRTMGG